MSIDMTPAARIRLPGRTLRLAGLAAALAAGAFAAGVLVGGREGRARPTFHDIRVNHVADLTALVDPGDPAVRALAEQLGAPEAAYAHVRDRIRYEPGAPAASPGDVIRDGAAGCLGKATLLCSLYRAMGIADGDVRVVTGNVVVPSGLADHAWVDFEYKGACLQQDPSGFLGSFAFAEFPERTFTRTFVFEEEYCFNETGFAVVSQLNRYRNDPSPGTRKPR